MRLMQVLQLLSFTTLTEHQFFIQTEFYNQFLIGMMFTLLPTVTS